MSVNISVIIPIYDYSIYVPTCLDSIFNQKLNNIEIILLNYSKNNINQLIHLYLNKSDNIKIIQNSFENFNSSFDQAINEAKGKYVAFFDSNDFLDSSMLEKLFNLSESNNLDIAMCKLSSIDDFTQEFDDDLHDLSLSILNNYEDKIFSGKDVLKVIPQIYSKPYNKLFNRSFLINNNISYPNFLFGDEIFFYDATLEGNDDSIA